MKQLQDYRQWAWNCFREGMCKHVFPWHLRSSEFYQICPSISRFKFDVYSAQGRLDIARAMIEGELEESDKLLEAIYACQLCCSCDYICGRVKEIQPGLVIQAMRAQHVTGEGKAPPAEFKPFLDDLREYLNPYKKPNAVRTNWLKGIEPETVAGISTPQTNKGDALLYVGCAPLRDPAAEQMPKTAINLLSRAGINVGILGEKERCCGNPSLRIGDVNQFIAFAKENIKLFNGLGVEKIIVTCPFCYSSFKRDYPEVGDKMNFEVVHILELMDQLLKEGKLKLTNPVNLKATYHDPCHLGRLNGPGIRGTGNATGIYEQPRSILKSIPGMQLVEMDRIKDDAFCCGAGSWMRNGYLDFALWTANERIKEAKSTGVHALVTYCPHCEENLGDAVKNSNEKMEILNLLDLVLEAMC